MNASDSHSSAGSDDTRPVLVASLEKLERSMRATDFRGWDPFDVLQSPLFRLPVLRTARLPRFAAQQVFKRLPFNLRPVLGIRRGLNPVTLGLVIQACAYLGEARPERRDELALVAENCLGRLDELVSTGYSGKCWGYDFDWEARYARMPAFTPTVVATGIVTNGLHVYSEITGNERARSMVLEAVPFVLKDLNRTIEGDEFCFSYSPVDTQVVFNATMKGARLLAQAFKITGSHDLADQARRTVAFVMRHQRSDGAWIYSSGDARTWVDNFHTGYVLDGLASYMECTGDDSFKAQYNKGLRFYLDSFIDDKGRPKYYDTRTWPVDCTAAGQMLLTLLEAGCVESANRVARWMMANMQAPGGNFHFQKHRHWTNRIPYMRWSDAWMFVGLCRFLWEIR